MGITIFIILIVVLIYFSVRQIKLQEENPKLGKLLYEEKQTKEKELTIEERQKFYNSVLMFSMVICDNNPKVKKVIIDYLKLPIDSFIKEYENLNKEMDLGDLTTTYNSNGIISLEIFGVVCVRILNYYGFVSSNDLSFTLEDMLLNFKQAFDYYHISSTLFDSIQNKDELMIWEHVNLIAEALPNEWLLCNWQIDGDEYNFFILEKQHIDKVFGILNNIGSLANIEIILVDPIYGLND